MKKQMIFGIMSLLIGAQSWAIQMDRKPLSCKTIYNYQSRKPSSKELLNEFVRSTEAEAANKASKSAKKAD